MDNCDVVRDLLPLYVDGVCSDASRRLVEEHIGTCPDCARMLSRLRDSACEDSLRQEATAVLAPRKWRNRAFAVSCALAAFLCVPACLLAQMGRPGASAFAWLRLLAPALLVVMSATMLPLRTRRYTGRWTLLGFTGSLLLLLMACAVYTAEGAELPAAETRLFLAAVLVLYGLSVAVLVPWAVKELPLRGRFAGKPRQAALVWDGTFAVLLAVSLCLMARPPRYWALGLGSAGVLALLVVTETGLYRRLPLNRWVRLGLDVTLAGNALAWLERPFLVLTGAERDVTALSGTVQLWLVAASTVLGLALVAWGIWKAYKRSGYKLF